jgi:hypothetical protein
MRLPWEAFPVVSFLDVATRLLAGHDPALRRRRTLAALALLAAASGCGKTVALPAPAAPPQEMPPVTLTGTPPPQGRQYVLLDTPGDEARVAELLDVDLPDGPGTVRHPLCVTPCVTDLRIGPHRLQFTSTRPGGAADDLQVDVGGGTLVVRHVLKRVPPQDHGTADALGVTAFCLGFASFLTAVTVLPIGAGGSNQGLVDAGVVAAVGIPVFYGIGALLLSYTKYYVPGATTQWTLPAQETGNAAGAPLPLLRF